MLPTGSSCRNRLSKRVKHEYSAKSLFIGLSLYTLTSAAALFDDTEARKKILDLEAKVQTKLDSQSAEIEDLKKRISIQSQGLLDMQSEIELLKQETAQLRGSLEVANHALETAEQRQKDLYADTDARIRNWKVVLHLVLNQVEHLFQVR